MESNDKTVFHPDIPLIDVHVHMEIPGLYDSIRESMDAVGIKRINLLSTARKNGGHVNDVLLHYKEKDPERFYIFASLDYQGSGGEAFDPTTMTAADRGALAERLGQQPARLKAQGFDGIKLLESKPDRRRDFPFPLDGEVYAVFFAAVDKERLPLLWHVGDPEDFWNPEKIRDFARAAGWLYDKPGDPALETMRGEAENVLARHPNLTVVFAHFYFLANKLPRARKMFETYPNVNFDVTPGAQMYRFFNDQREEARRFFIEFQDRIVVGTDLVSWRGQPTWNAKGAANVWRRMRAYFGSDEAMPREFPGMNNFFAPDETLRGLDLPKETLVKLFHGNFERVAGSAPAKLPKRP
jgi:predicted TIM-barrel fold metal-dependent hydrolase